ncbi:MAG: hypothetical protein M3R38_05385 [Actinomycetota bacterium]|nr:hypothetical protein [Actinomycetota bacterium]
MVEKGLRVFVTGGSLGKTKRTAYALGEIDRKIGQDGGVDAGLSSGLYAVPGEVTESFSYCEGGIAVVRQDSPGEVCCQGGESSLYFSTTAERG